MRRLIAAAAAVLAAGIGVAVPGTAMASSAPSWNRVFQSSKTGTFFSIAALSERNIWAAAYLSKGTKPLYEPYVVHFNGSTWKPVTIPGAKMVSTSVQATSASNVWVFGLTPTSNNVYASGAYRWGGSHWHKIPVPRLTDFQGTTVLGPSNVWAFGSGDVPGDIYHWNGHSWKIYNINFFPQSISASSAHNVWLTGMKWSGKNWKAAAYRWNGSRWLAVRSPHPDVDTGPMVTVVSPSNVWMGWNTTTAVHALHWNGRKWTEITAPDTVAADGAEIAPDGRGGYWFGPFAVWTGHNWISTPDVSPANAGGPMGPAVHIPGTSSSLMAAGVRNKISSAQHPTIYRINLG